jgi:chromosome segregation ATPase
MHCKQPFLVEQEEQPAEETKQKAVDTGLIDELTTEVGKLQERNRELEEAAEFAHQLRLELQSCLSALSRFEDARKSDQERIAQIAKEHETRTAENSRQADQIQALQQQLLQSSAPAEGKEAQSGTAIAQELETAWAEGHTLRTRVSELEQALAASAASCDAIKAQAAQELEQARHGHESELQDLRAHLEQAHQNRAHAEEQHGTSTQQLHEENQRIRQELASAHEQRQHLEEVRGMLQAETGDLKSRLEEALLAHHQAGEQHGNLVQQLQDEAQHVRQELATAQQAHAAHTASSHEQQQQLEQHRGALESQISDLKSRLKRSKEEHHEAIEHQGSVAQRLQEENQRIRQELEKACQEHAAHAASFQEQLNAERHRAEEAGHAFRTEIQRLLEESTGLREQLASRTAASEALERESRERYANPESSHTELRSSSAKNLQEAARRADDLFATLEQQKLAKAGAERVDLQKVLQSVRAELAAVGERNAGLSAERAQTGPSLDEREEQWARERRNLEEENDMLRKETQTLRQALDSRPPHH